MPFNTLKTFLVVVGDYIYEKLKTKEGRLALIITGSIITGGSAINAWDKTHAYKIKAKEYEELKNDKQEADSLLRVFVQTAEADCNKRVREGALLHRELRDIYNNKTLEIEQSVETQKLLEQQKEEILSIQEDNIKALKKLKE